MPRVLAPSLCGLVAYASFVACGGVTDPFSPSGNAGAVGRAGASSVGGAQAHGGGANAGASSAAGAGATEGGASNGGSGAAGASNAGASGAPQAGASNLAGAGTGGGAGSTASAGSGGSSGDSCQTLLAKASTQLAAAQACDYAVDSLQCRGTVTNPCKCEVPVNSQNSEQTKAYQDTLDQLDKQKCVQLCTAIACSPVSRAECVAPNDGGMTGTCRALHAVPL